MLKEENKKNDSTDIQDTSKLKMTEVNNSKICFLENSKKFLELK